MESPEKNEILAVKEKGSDERSSHGSKGRNSVVKIFRYADWVDVVLMVLGTVGAVGDGMSTNCLLVFVSRLMNNLGYGQSQQNNNHGIHWMHEVEKVSWIIIIVSLSLNGAAVGFSLSSTTNSFSHYVSHFPSVNCVFCLVNSAA